MAECAEVPVVHGAMAAGPPPDRLAVPVVDAHCHLDLMEGDLADERGAGAAVGITAVLVDRHRYCDSRSGRSTRPRGTPTCGPPSRSTPTKSSRQATGDADLAEIERSRA